MCLDEIACVCEKGLLGVCPGPLVAPPCLAPLPWPAASASIGGISVGSYYQLVCAVNVTLGGDYDVDGAQLR